VAERRGSVRWGRLAAAVVVLVVAAALGVVGTLNNWYAFALGRVSISEPPTAGLSPTATPESLPSVSPAATSGPASDDAAYLEGYRAGRSDGVADGFRAGRASGREVGYRHGRARGHEVGKKLGYEAGYSAGYQAGYSVGFNKGHRCVAPVTFCSQLPGSS